MTKIKLLDIKVGERFREDLGDLEGLALSIRDNGLMHPIVIDADNNLIAGGRRHAALTLLATNKVQCENPEFYKETAFTQFESLSPAKRKMLEIEENHRRKDVTWQEQVLGLAEYHKLAQREALRDGEEWSQELTGKLLNISQASVSVALMIAKDIKANRDCEIAKCASLKDALTVRAVKKLDEAAKEQLRRIQSRQLESANNVVLARAQVQITPEDLAKVTLQSARTVEDVARDVLTPKLTGPSMQEIAAFYYHGDCLDIIPEIAKKTVINHIICDPPYGISMSNLDAANVASVAATHNVENNLEMLPKFLKVAYDHIAEDGFLCMWYDLDHHEKIKNWAEKIGWKVCRWPLVWCKTSTCANQSAQYNITKSTEVCYFLRRSEKSIIKGKQSKNYILSDAVTSGTHAFVKPDAVWKYCLETVSTEKQTILDPFAGEGSGLAATFKYGRLPIGIEIDNSHIANGLNYIQKQLAFSSTDELLSRLPI